MTFEDAYSGQVRALFMNLDHGGSLQGRPGALSGQGGTRAQGAMVRLWLQVGGEQATAARFEAYGCPYVLAAAESLCRWLANRRRSELDGWNWRIPEAELRAPPEKRTRLLIVEDALRSAAVAWARSLASQAN